MNSSSSCSKHVHSECVAVCVGQSAELLDAKADLVPASAAYCTIGARRKTHRDIASTHGA